MNNENHLHEYAVQGGSQPSTLQLLVNNGAMTGHYYWVVTML